MRRHTAALALCAVFTAALAASLSWGDPLERLLATLRLPRRLEDGVPRVAHGWTGRDQPLTDKERRAIGADDSLQRGYLGPRGEKLTLFISFHGNKERGLQRYYHNPTICYRDAGWTLVATRFERVTLQEVGQELPTCRYVFERDGAKLAVTTFFKVDDELLDESPRNKPFWMLREKMTPALGDDPGSVVQVQLVVPIGEGGEEAAAAATARFLQAFGRDLRSAIQVGVGS